MARCIFHIDLGVFFVSVAKALNLKLKGEGVFQRRVKELVSKSD